MCLVNLAFLAVVKLCIALHWKPFSWVCLTFVAVLTLRLKLTSVSHSVPSYDQVIPMDYALAHFPHKSQTITFQLPGQSKKWPCEFRVRSDGGRCSRYWSDFARDNHLLVGDLCLFQPMKKAKGRKFKVMVHLIRNGGIEHPSSEILPPQCVLRMSRLTVC
jgi:hypothetical protein